MLNSLKQAYKTSSLTLRWIRISITYSLLIVDKQLNFIQLERFSDYSEQYFRIHFENKFDFQAFNLYLIQQQNMAECVTAFDPSYISKSGKSTLGVNEYWLGCSK